MIANGRVLPAIFFAYLGADKKISQNRKKFKNFPRIAVLDTSYRVDD